MNLQDQDFIKDTKGVTIIETAFLAGLVAILMFAAVQSTKAETLIDNNSIFTPKAEQPLH